MSIITAETNLILVNTALYTNTLVYLSNTNPIGQIITIRDISGGASSNNIVRISTISGVSIQPPLSGINSNFIEIQQPYGAVTVSYNGNNVWNVLNTFAFQNQQSALVNNVSVSSISMKDSITNIYSLIGLTNGSLQINGNSIGSAGSSSSGISSLSSIVSYGLSSIGSGGSGISSLSSIVSYGLSSLVSSGGLSSLSSIVSYGLSSIGSGGVFGISSLSSIVSYGLSSLVGSGGISSLSSIVSYGLSSLVGSGGISSLSSIVSYGLSSVISSGGISSLSSIVSYGLSSVMGVNRGGISSLSSIVSYGLSSVMGVNRGGISSLSSIVSYGLSSVVGSGGTFGISSLSSIVSYGLSSINYTQEQLTTKLNNGTIDNLTMNTLTINDAFTFTNNPANPEYIRLTLTGNNGLELFSSNGWYTNIRNNNILIQDSNRTNLILSNYISVESIDGSVNSKITKSNIRITNINSNFIDITPNNIVFTTDNNYIDTQEIYTDKINLGSNNQPLTISCNILVRSNKYPINPIAAYIGVEHFDNPTYRFYTMYPLCTTIKNNIIESINVVNVCGVQTNYVNIFANINTIVLNPGYTIIIRSNAEEPFINVSNISYYSSNIKTYPGSGLIEILLSPNLNYSLFPI